MMGARRVLEPDVGGILQHEGARAIPLWIVRFGECGDKWAQIALVRIRRRRWGLGRLGTWCSEREDLVTPVSDHRNETVRDPARPHLCFVRIAIDGRHGLRRRERRPNRGRGRTPPQGQSPRFPLPPPRCTSAVLYVNGSGPTACISSQILLLVARQGLSPTRTR